VGSWPRDCGPPKQITAGTTSRTITRGESSEARARHAGGCLGGCDGKGRPVRREGVFTVWVPQARGVHAAEPFAWHGRWNNVDKQTPTLRDAFAWSDRLFLFHHLFRVECGQQVRCHVPCISSAPGLLGMHHASHRRQLLAMIRPSSYMSSGGSNIWYRH
jgi:hypothetical protein